MDPVSIRPPNDVIYSRRSTTRRISRVSTLRRTSARLMSIWVRAARKLVFPLRRTPFISSARQTVSPTPTSTHRLIDHAVPGRSGQCSRTKQDEMNRSVPCTLISVSNRSSSPRRTKPTCQFSKLFGGSLSPSRSAVTASLPCLLARAVREASKLFFRPRPSRQGPTTLRQYHPRRSVWARQHGESSSMSPPSRMSARVGSRRVDILFLR